MSLTRPITFILNDETKTVEISPTLVALDYLRKRESLTGSKEGCKEGDCGACCVIVGTLKAGDVEYRPVTSCLLPMGDLQGKHLLTIEGLSQSKLSPLQEAMVDCGGTQCGYCTPGFIVAMTAGLMDESIPLNDDGADYAISGNLCRCTGYRSIKQAGRSVISNLAGTLLDQPRLAALCQSNVLPPYLLEIPGRLEEIEEPVQPEPAPPFIAGGTDLFVQRGEELPRVKASLLNRLPRQAVALDGDFVVCDANETFEAFARSPIIRDMLPSISEYNEAIASWPIRERATLGGNICNASPIADITSLLLALESDLTLTNGSETRSLSLDQFYLGYKKLAKSEGERLVAIRFKKLLRNEFFNWEKVSKRRVLDIATLNSAAKIEVEDNTITSATISLGGVAATPLTLVQTAQELVGVPLSIEAIAPILERAQEEFSPISDVRGSADYKRLLARQLVWAHFRKLFAANLDEEALYEALR